MKGLSRKILISILAISAMTVSSVSVSAMDIPIGNIGSTDISDTQEPKETLYTAIHNNVQVNMTENPVTRFKAYKYQLID